MAKPKEDETGVGGNSGAMLRAHIEAIENLTVEKQAIADDIKDRFLMAKGQGLDPKIMRIILRRRAMDAAKRAEQDALVDTYSRAVGTPSPADPDAVHDEE